MSYRYAILAALLSCSVYEAAVAQTMLGTVRLFTDGPNAQVEASPEPAQKIEAAKPLMRLRHLPRSSSGWRIDGEIGELAWQVFATADEVAATRTFRVAYQSAVSVLPDVSGFTVSINGAVIGRSPVAAPADVKPIEFALPPNVLRAGFNTIRLSMQQRHRVDCTPEATYELWTRIDPAQSGLIGPAGHEAPKAGDHAALRPRADGALVIRILIEGRIKPARVNQLLRVVQAIALASRSERVLVSFAADVDATHGLNVVVGGDPDTSSQPVALAAGKGGAAPTLTLGDVDDASLAGLIAQLVPSSKQASSGEVAIEGGERVRLGEFGVIAEEFSGRLYRHAMHVRMPDDFLAADYDKLSFNFAGVHGAGLTQDAMLQVIINGKDAASMPLSNAAGGSFRENDIAVPLGMLRPGRNTIEIAARLPNTSDQSCHNDIALDAAPKRFVLSADSDIRFPRLARIARLPELTQTTASGYPYTIANSHPKLYVPAPDRDSLSAALTLAVRVAIDARRLVPFELVVGSPQPSSDHALVVAAARALDPMVMREIGLDPDAIRVIWQKRTAPKVSELGVEPARNVTPGLQTISLASLSPDLSNKASVEWQALVNRRSWVERTWTGIHTYLSSTYYAALASLRNAGEFLAGHAEGQQIDATASLVVAQGFRTAAHSGVVTIVTAAEPAMLSRAVEDLVDPQKWSGLRGRLTVLGETGDVLSAADSANLRLIPTQPPSLSNYRLVLAAWLSLHPAVYVMAALMMAGLLACATSLLVRNLGRRNA